jgi:hypothetical protein
VKAPQLLLDAANTAATALLTPIQAEIVRYLLGEVASLPAILSDPSLHGRKAASRIALDAAKARQEFARQKSEGK